LPSFLYAEMVGYNIL
nr:RecName: Full=Miltpain [Oncorhynchus keta]